MFRLDKIPHSQIIHTKIALIGLTYSWYAFWKEAILQ